MFPMLTPFFDVFKSIIHLLWIRFKIRFQDFYLRTKLTPSVTILDPNGFHTQITELKSAGFQVYQAPIGYQRLGELMEKRIKASFMQDDWSTFKESITQTQQILGIANVYVGDNLLWIQGPYENQFHYYKLPPPLWI
jgi:hypothetical protein